MKVNILDLIDFEKVDILLEGFNKTTGFVTAILDLDGNVLSKSGWRQMCTHFHRINPETAKKCTISDTVLANKMAEGEKYHFYKCLNGLVDVAVPIVINDEHIANLFSGQFFFEEPDRVFFKKQAEKYGFDENKYLEALEKVPVVSKEKVRTAMEFLLGMTQLISETTYQRQEQTELNKILNSNKERQQTILETAMDGFWLVDQQGRFLDVNEVACKMIGYSRVEMLQMKIANIEVLETHEIIKSRIDKINATGEDRFESKHRCKDGSVIEVEISTKLQGNRNLFVCFVRDITDPKKAENELKESEFNLRKAQQMSHIGSWKWTIATDTVNWSEELFRINGLEPKPQAPGFAEQDDLSTPESRKRLKAAIDKSMQNGESYEIELEHISPQDKNIKHTIARGEPVFDSYGKIIGFQGTLQDITDRKNAEKALRISEERFSLAMKAANDGLFDWNLETNEIYYAPAWKKMLGYEDHELANDFSVWENTTEPEDVKKSWEMQQKLISKEIDRFVLEFKMKHKDGHLVHILSRAEAIFNDNGKAIRIVGTHTDITDRKETEEKLVASQAKLSETLEMSNRARQSLLSVLEDQRRAQQEINKLNAELEQRVIDRTAQLEAVNKELEAFSYSVSHDLRAPLRHISGFADMLAKDVDDQLSEKARHYLNTINISARKMGNLIDDLLSFSRAGRVEMKKTSFVMNELVEEALTQIKFAVAGREINWKIASLPEVLGDYGLLRLVWVNLLDNAAKYTRTRDKAVIEVDCTEQENEYVFRICDNGVGFDMQYAAKLFGVFQRMHTIAEFEGTGIGLANVRRIILRHGGRTWAEAEMDKGATFYFALPKRQ